MAMVIEDAHVEFETSKLLKEVGLPLGCVADSYDHKTGKMYNSLCPWSDYDTPAPTQAAVMRWLREERDIVIEVRSTWLYGKHTYNVRFYADNGNLRSMCGSIEYATYEVALETGIQFACAHLLKKNDWKPYA